VSVQTFPMFAPTRAIPPVALPGVPPGLPSYFFHWLFAQVFWHGGNLGFKQLRKADPASFDLDLHWPFYPDEERGITPLLLAYSPTVLPRPADWSASHIHIPGYLFLEGSQSYQPPESLNNFLAGGKPPVCVTFGSTIHRDAQRVYRSVLQAMEATGNRAILLSGWSDLRSLPLPAHILAMESVPHDWLFPRCAAVVHHGGAGTTAAGLRAGIPNLVIPFASDQPFWGRCVQRLGAGPAPIPVRRLTARGLIAALITAEGEAVRNSARTVGSKIRAEDGVHSAVGIIQQHAARWQA
jgi:sterol 3beta-glucosyltransferase